MSKYMIGVPYLEDEDVNTDATLASWVGNGKPTVVMVQGVFCGFCTKAKPDFEKFSKSAQNCVGVTVQTDGTPQERKAVDKLKKVNTSPGVPAFLGFDKNGKFVSVYNGDRTMQGLMKFASSL